MPESEARGLPQVPGFPALASHDQPNEKCGASSVTLGEAGLTIPPSCTPAVGTFGRGFFMRLPPAASGLQQFLRVEGRPRFRPTWGCSGVSRIGAFKSALGRQMGQATRGGPLPAGLTACREPASIVAAPTAESGTPRYLPPPGITYDDGVITGRVARDCGPFSLHPVAPKMPSRSVPPASAYGGVEPSVVATIF